MRTRVKICGITTQTDLSLAVDAGADAIGVITSIPVDSPRSVSHDKAAALIDAVPPFVTSVLVTMPDTAEEALSLYETLSPDVLQLHGTLSEGMLRTIAERVPLIHAVDADDTDTMTMASSLADALLIDSLDIDGAGGTGTPHDWDVARRHVESLDIPVILAGGLTADNVEIAIDTVQPFAVDVASGVEGPDGKIPHEVRRFVKAVRSSQGGTE